MRITVIGSGYVGLVTGACLAEVGNDVLCVDVDASKIATSSERPVSGVSVWLKVSSRTPRRDSS